MPIVITLSNERSDKLIVGDFNIDMLKTNTRNKYSDFLDLMLNNDFAPKITLPTRFAVKSGTIIDNIFCNFTNYTKACKSGIIFSNLSDHLPYFTCLSQKVSLNVPPKYIKVQTNNPQSIQNFYQELNMTDITQTLNQNLNTDPNMNYNKFISIILKAKDKHLPIKTVKFNKYKHKLTHWVTQCILRSIKFRDNLYRQLKCTNQEKPQYQIIKHNLKMCSKML